MVDMNPDAAAEYAMGGPDGIPSDPGSGGIPDGMSIEGPGGNGIVDRLFDGAASGPPVQQVESDYGLPKWGALVVRGIVRAAPGDGMPPIGDIGLGAILGVLANRDGDGGSVPQEPAIEEEIGGGGL